MEMFNIPDVFSDEHVRKEIEFMEFSGTDTITHGDVTILLKPIIGRCDDYLSTNYRADETLVCPIMLIDGSLWMSLTPMEIQSNYLPYRLAAGNCANIGLGLGYSTLRMAGNTDVEHVDVYEQNQDVIDYFKDKYAKRPEMSKISFIHGDARETMKGKEYDYAYSDIYSTMLPDEIITDIELFNKNNHISQYRFWGQEKVYNSAYHLYGYQAEDLPYLDRAFIVKWAQSPMIGSPSFCHDQKFVDQVMEALEGVSA